MSKKFFGTDGIRKKVGHKHMNPEFAVKLGYAAGLAFKESSLNRRPKVLIGKDTRISGYLIESALKSGFSAAGVNVAMLGPIPTPAVAYLTRTFHCCAGVVVSASHNPYYDNGIKFFSDRGRKLDDNLENRIEYYLNKYENKLIDLVDSSNLGKAKRINDAYGRYIEHCKSSIAPMLELTGIKIVIDCANGATYKVGPAVFKELGADVTIINAEPDGQNINYYCGSTDVDSLIKKVIGIKADIGIAFDGDGDRVVIVDSKGKEIDGDAILYLIIKGLIKNDKKPIGVVGTIMTNLGTISAINKLGVNFKSADVGDRNVMKELISNGWNLGGESSGHIICLNKSTTGDGIIAALQVLETMKDTNMSIEQLLSDYRLYPMKIINLDVTDKSLVMQDNKLLSEIEKANNNLKDKGRLLIRASGTESKIRVMVESKYEQTVNDTIDYFVNLVKEIGEKYA